MVGRITPIRSAGGIASYAAKEDYHAAGAAEPGTWFGRGAEALGLQGQPSKSELIRVFEGRLPTGEQLGRIEKDQATGESKVSHRPGWEYTFSAPKSVSVAALVYGDDRLVGAHQAAVKATMAWIEKEAAQARIGGEKVKTESLVAALYTHNTSRAQDPQLHTHALIANATIDQNGKARSLEPKEIYRLQTLISSRYHSELAAQASALGYSVDRTKAAFELKGISAELRDTFSKRTDQRDAKLAERGLTPDQANYRDRENAVLNTRESKRIEDSQVLKARWEKEAATTKAADQEARATVQAAKEKSAGVETLPDQVARLNPAQAARAADQAVRFAAATLAERNATFSHDALVKEALHQALGKAGPDQVDRVVAGMVRSGELLPRTAVEVNYKAEGERVAVAGYTTPAAMKTEREILAMEKAGRGTVAPLMTTTQADAYIAKIEERERKAAEAAGKVAFDWSKGQRESTKTLLTTGNATTGLQGAAGTGKTTTAMQAVVEAYEKAGYQVTLMAPTGKAAETLGKELGRPADTVAMHFINLENERKNGGATAEARQAARALDQAQRFSAGAQATVDRALFGRRSMEQYERTFRAQDGTLLGKGADGKWAPVRANAFESKDGAILHSVGGKWQRADVLTTFARDVAVVGVRAYGAVKERQAERAANAAASEAAKPKLWVADEASLMSSQDLHRLQQEASRENARLILAGDAKQHTSPIAGKPFEQLQKNGMITGVIGAEDIVRQRTAEAREAVAAAERGDAKTAFRLLGEAGVVKVLEDASSAKNRQEAVAASYLALPQGERATTLIIDPRKDGSDKINEEIRKGLKAEGEIKGPAVTVTSWRSIDLTSVQKTDAKAYDLQYHNTERAQAKLEPYAGMHVRFSDDVRSQGLSKGYYEVVGFNGEANTVTLRDRAGADHVWNPSASGANKAEVYEPRQLEIQAGDRMTITRGDRKENVLNGWTGTVAKVDPKHNTYTVQFDGQTENRRFDAGKDTHSHIDRGWAMTSVKAQGMTVDRVIAHLDSQRYNLMDKTTFYNTLARAKEDWVIHTDSLPKLIGAVETRESTKTTAHEGYAPAGGARIEAAGASNVIEFPAGRTAPAEQQIAEPKSAVAQEVGHAPGERAPAAEARDFPSPATNNAPGNEASTAGAGEKGESPMPAATLKEPSMTEQVFGAVDQALDTLHTVADASLDAAINLHQGAAEALITGIQGVDVGAEVSNALDQAFNDALSNIGEQLVDSLVDMLSAGDAGKQFDPEAEARAEVARILADQGVEAPGVESAADARAEPRVEADLAEVAERDQAADHESPAIERDSLAVSDADVGMDHDHAQGAQDLGADDLAVRDSDLGIESSTGNEASTSADASKTAEREDSADAQAVAIETEKEH